MYTYNVFLCQYLLKWNRLCGAWVSVVFLWVIQNNLIAQKRVWFCVGCGFGELGIRLFMEGWGAKVGFKGPVIMQTSLVICIRSLLVKSPEQSIRPAACAVRKQKAKPNKQVEKRNKGSEMARLLLLASHSGCHWSQLFQRILLLMKVGAHRRGRGSRSAAFCLFCPSFKIVFSTLFQVNTCLLSAEPLNWFGVRDDSDWYRSHIIENSQDFFFSH